MDSPQDLRAEAEAAEHLASIVSYARDKQRLLQLAADLRERADALARAEERRTWKPRR